MGNKELLRPRSRQSRDPLIEANQNMSDRTSRNSIINNPKPPENLLVRVHQARAGGRENYHVLRAERTKSTTRTHLLSPLDYRKENCILPKEASVESLLVDAKARTPPPALAIERSRPRAQTTSTPGEELKHQDDKQENKKRLDRNRKSMRKRVFSKVKEGVLMRSTSTSKASNASSEAVNLDDTDTDAMRTPEGLCISSHATGKDQATCRTSACKGWDGADSQARALWGLPTIDTYRLAASITVDANLSHDDFEPFWATVRVNVAGSCGQIDNVRRSDPGLPPFTNIQLAVKASHAYTVHELYGNTYIDRLDTGGSFTVHVKIGQKPYAVRNENAFDELCSEIESMLGDSTTEVFAVKIKYCHPGFPSDTSMILRKVCAMQSSNARENVDLARSSANKALVEQGESIPTPAAGLTAVGTPPADCQRGGVHIHSRDPGQSPLRYPGHGTVLVPALSGLLVHRPDPAREKTSDAARQIWRHMRRDSKTISSVPDVEAVTDGQLQSRRDTGVVVSAMRKVALANKRSVDEETLREWEDNLFLTMQTKNASSQSMPEFGIPCGLTSVPWL